MSINQKILEAAEESFNKHWNNPKLKEKNFITIVDLGVHSSKKRLYVYDWVKKKVIRSHHVAHGQGSDWNNTGYAHDFSNRNMSKKSAKGGYITGKTYRWGKRFPTPNKLKLHGLDKTNNNAFSRAVVMHSSAYVTNGTIRRTGKVGRSWGCPAVDPAIAEDLIDMLKEGSFLYINSSRML